MKKSARQPGRRLIMTIMVFFASAFILLFLRDLSMLSFAMAVIVPVIFLASTLLIAKLFPADQLLLALINFLTALGVLVLYRMDPQKGFSQAVNYGASVVGMLFFILLMRRWQRWDLLAWIAGAGALGLMALPVLLGSEINGARAWISLAGISVQPSELVKVLLLLVEAWWLSKRKYLLALPFAACCLGLLMLQKDLGTALVYYITVLIMVFAASGSFALLGLGVVGAGAGAYVGYNMFSHVKKRVRVWINPWLDPAGEGYQIVQGLLAMVNGGLWGVGLGSGNAYDIPAYSTDYIFSIITNEFGVIFGICVILLYIALLLRGVSIAMRARSSFHMLLALGSCCMLIIQMFIIIGGNIKMIPLTGVTLPFISYGGTSLVSSMCIMGLLQGVASINDSFLQQDARMATVEDVV